eukprot:scaffold765_cov345-Prasinococcus_capsulatus_cf.AAC.5
MVEHGADEALFEAPHVGPFTPFGLQELREQEEGQMLGELEEQGNGHYFLFPSLESLSRNGGPPCRTAATAFGSPYEEEIFILGDRYVVPLPSRKGR